MSNSQKPTTSVQQSLEHIAIRLDEMTGNAMGTSYLHVTSDTRFSEDIVNELDTLNKKVENLDSTLSELVKSMEELEYNLRPLATISENLELIMMAYVQSQNKK